MVLLLDITNGFFSLAVSRSISITDAFEPLTSLVHVDLFNNPRLASSVFISDSFVRLPPSLRQLGLANNKLFEHIPPAILNDSSLPNVEIINLSGNVFFSLVSSQFPESSLSGLKYLIMEGCSISSIRVCPSCN